MKIPVKFDKILKESQILNAIILDVITSFEPIYTDNKLFFFEEYTDHGIDHIEKVLASAEYIISDESFGKLTSKEIAILILSIILHDIGMHCEFSTFVGLLDGHNDQYRISELDSKTWAELWKDYLAEVKRFSSHQKKNVFGNEFQPYKEPDLYNKDNLTGYDKKLIGEFIRRNHTRLAHEIAFSGIYGSNGNKISFGNEKMSQLYRQLSGILARSHGMNIRDTFNYLVEIGSAGWRNPDDINIVFLMVVIRIADYIQIDKNRVSPFLLKLKTFNSPISLNEHKTHLAIESLSFNQPDSERIFLTCNPLNSEMLVKLQSLFNDIQKELDISWAIIGEVYGILTSDIPKIKYRRIMSNIDDHSFLEKLDFVPKRVKFEVNNDLSKLLVGPLYGNNPTYGVRELVQNAVDACLERDHIEKQKLNNDYIPSIIVSIKTIDNETSLFSIIDNGKGMSLEEIMHYFLNVGSSFRKSLAWKKDFIDEHGHSTINRNGKFGIGVLAAFLIGEEIVVKTKLSTDLNSYTFKTSIDGDFIDIKKISEDFVGTHISIIISSEIKDQLLIEGSENKSYANVWTDWYVNNYPKVVFVVDGKEVKRKIEISKQGMNIFQTENFKNINWKYFGEYLPHKKNTFSDTAVVCNGILVTRGLDYSKRFFYYLPDKHSEYVLQKKPSFFFEDPEGVFPIKLDRNDIDCSKLPFENELLAEVAKSFIATILTLEINNSSSIKEVQIENSNAKILYSQNGFVLNFDYFINKLNGYSLVRIITERNYISSKFLSYPNCFIFIKPNERINLSYQQSNVASRSATRVLLKESSYSNLFESSKRRLPVWIKDSHRIIFRTNGVVVYDFQHYLDNECQKKSHILNDIESIKNIDVQNVESIQEMNFDFFKIKGGDILNSLLKTYISDDFIIPYDIEERKMKYPKAFQELASFISHYLEKDTEKL